MMWLSLYLFVLVLPSVFLSWNAHDYWNSRYGTKGVAYTADDSRNGLWSALHSLKDPYLHESSSYNSEMCSGCSCVENVGIRACNAPVNVVLQNFPSVNNETFAATVTSIKILNCPSFTSIGEKTFDHLTRLTHLTIHLTGIVEVPDVSQTSLEILNLASNSIKITPKNLRGWKLPSTITHLALMNNQISWLPENFISGPNLRVVSLSGNQLIYIPEAAFMPNNIPNLLYVGLDGNQIKRVSTDHISPFTTSLNFIHLNLTNNVLTYIEPAALRTLTNLKILELQWNSISKIYLDQFNAIPELLHLDLHQNELSEITSNAFVNLPNLIEFRLHSQKIPLAKIAFDAFVDIGAELKNIFLSDNGLTTFPHPVLSEGSYPKLQYIFADHNRIQNVSIYGEDAFPVSKRILYQQKKADFRPFDSSPNVIQLHLSNNAIESVNTDYCSLLVLSSLYLDSNLITEDFIHPEAFQCLPRLTNLHLQQNNIQYVTDVLSSNNSLMVIKTLSLTSNKLTFLLAGTFSRLTTLRSLVLNNNKILTMENDAFPDQLESLNLQNNQIRFLHTQPFSNLGYLSTLYLSSNRIEYLPDAIFYNCTALKYLILGNNQIPQIRKLHFQHCSLISTLDLQSNQIGWIEDGSFAHLSNAHSIYLQNNQLSQLPLGGDFHDLSLSGYLSFSNNRITTLATGVFKNLRTYGLFLSGNKIAVIESNSFQSVSVSLSILLNGNPLREIQSYAFNITSAYDIQLNNLQLTRIPSYAFNDVSISQSLNLASNYISDIDQDAFHKVSVQKLYLSFNRLEFLSGMIFGSSSVTSMWLNNNNLNSMAADAFDSLTLTNIYLSQNLMTLYPLTLATHSLQVIDIQSNEISFLPPGSFTGQTTLKKLFLNNNKLMKVDANILTSLTGLEELYLHNNNIQLISVGAFDNLNNLVKLQMDNNYLHHVPTFPVLTDLKQLSLTSNMIGSMGNKAFSQLSALKSLDLSGNPLGCECNTVRSLDDIIALLDVSVLASCSYPAAVSSVMFDSGRKDDPTYYENSDPTLFQCTGSNLRVKSVSTTNIEMEWDRPDSLHVYFVASNDTYTAAITTGPWNYLITCDSSSTASLTDVVTGDDATLSVMFDETDGVQYGTMYTCHVKLQVDGYTSSASGPAIVWTPVLTVNDTTGIIATDIVLSVRYYDFSTTHPDFDGIYESTITIPTYIPSPYGAWLAISDMPTDDSFSDWFRSVPGTNQVFEQRLVLELDSGIHRYYSGDFFPLDDQGFGSQGQKDCNDEPHNFGFTSAVRTGLNFSGEEVVTVGGGEGLWLFINKVLVLEVIVDGETMPCHRIDLSPASQTGGGEVVPDVGVIDEGTCTGLHSLPSATFHLELEIGQVYHFDLFHTEQQLCNSHLLMEAENTNLIGLIGSANGIAPLDYDVSIPEDFHVDGILETIYLTDVFSVGPDFDVGILTGNKAGHFMFKANTEANILSSVAPILPPANYTYISGVPVSFLACDNTASITQEPDIATQGHFVLNTPTALLTLSSVLDYEVATEYILTMEVVDPHGPIHILTGTVAVRIRVQDVNDNCPVLSETSYTVTPIPVLQLSPLLTVNATDADSGQKDNFTYYVSAVTEDPPVSYSRSEDLYKSIYPNTTDLTFQVVVVDGGIPLRGASASVTVTVSNTCVLSATFQRIQYNLIVANSTGELFLRIPKYWVYKYECKDYIHLSKGVVRDQLLTASSSKNESTLPSRGRLNIATSEEEMLAGGWVAEIFDQNQYFQVDMELPYKFTRIHTQGLDSEPLWVTSLRVFYSDNLTDSWTLYSNDASETIFSANQNQDTVVDIELNPPILSRYIRLNPWTWSGGIALRLELSGCRQDLQHHYDISCVRCYTTWYCEGDGERRPCGRCDGDDGTCSADLYEHSFGGAAVCSPCPTGWLCHDGYALPCPNLHYAECNDTFCPSSCAVCQAGMSCFGGQKLLCDVGTSSTSEMEFCESCPAGTYQDETGQSSCKQCLAGYHSSPMSDRCSACTPAMYSTAGSSCVPCTSVTECPCMDKDTCFSQTTCVNTGSGGHQCLDCPIGYDGDGTSCVDINECELYQPCWNYSACVNSVPGYQCKACPPGYTGTYEDALAWNVNRRVFKLMNNAYSTIQVQTCTDVDECAVDNGGCDIHSKCTNTVGSLLCGFCGEGYIGNSRIGCSPADFCSTGKHTCTSTSECVYLGPRQYKCQCKEGYAGSGKYCGIDHDLDGHPDISLQCADWGCKRDNCRLMPNSGQEDADGDQAGDLCDKDDDNDGYLDYMDNCQYVRNFAQTDGDGDGIGDDCDLCPGVDSPDQTDTDGDDVGDICDTDDDNDGVLDGTDNCPRVANPLQENSDSDSFGDVCDNCIYVDNDDQSDTDQNGFGNICDVIGATNKDRDGDGVLDFVDNCLEVANADQADTDADGTGDVCDSDLDGDGQINYVDNCPFTHNPLQQDVDGDLTGDACEGDTDSDGVTNENDTCPMNKFISITSFQSHFVVILDPTMAGTQPDWTVTSMGIQISQNAQSEIPAMLIGEEQYGAVEYSGTWFVNSAKGSNYVGFVFGYVSNMKFYVVIWRGGNMNYGGTAYRVGIKGLQIKLVKSVTGPSSSMSQAIWHSADTNEQVTLLWHEPSMTGWRPFTAYRWHLTHHPSTGRIRLLVYNGTDLLADSGNVYDTAITGGRLGVLEFNQSQVIWSNLHAACLENENKALYLDGIDDYVMLPNVGDIQMKLSFTFTSWLFLETGYPSSPLPIFCTLSRLICLWIEGGFLQGNYGTKNISSTTVLQADTWHHVMFRYDGQDETLTIFLNGASTVLIHVYEAQEIDIRPIEWSENRADEDTVLYLGRDESSFFQGYLDEVRLFGIAIPDTEVNYHLQLATLDKAKLQRYANLYYIMDDTSGGTTLTDSGWLGKNGQIFGEPRFVESHSARRFQHTYPDN